MVVHTLRWLLLLRPSKLNERQGSGMDRTFARHRTYKHRPAVFIGHLPSDVHQLEQGVLTFTLEPITRHALAGAAHQWPGANVFTDGHHPTLRFGTVYVTEAAAWFGLERAQQAGAEMLERCWRWLTAAVRTEWREPNVHLLATPGTTGRDLWARTVPGAGYALMGADLQQWLRNTSGQARTEVFAAHAPTIAELVEYDMRMAYVACTRGLPTGVPVVTTNDVTFSSLEQLRQPGRYTVTFRPPVNWQQPGILPVHDGVRWSWPTSSAWHGPTVVDGCELAQAFAHGWEIRSAGQCVRWPDRCDPYRTMVARCERILANAQRALSPLGYGLVRAAVRNMLLHTIGAMHGNGHRIGLDIAPGDVLEGDTVQSVNSDGTVHVRRDTTASIWPALSHPEWTTHVWARARYRLLEAPGGTGLFNMPAGVRPVAIRTDAVYVTGQTGWPAPATDSHVGGWVRKRVAHNVAWPANRTELLKVRGS